MTWFRLNLDELIKNLIVSAANGITFKIIYKWRINKLNFRLGYLTK